MIERTELLKSDHFGIEIEDNRALVMSLLRVKIRPFWDWNYLVVCYFNIVIEVKIRPFWDWNNIISLFNLTKFRVKIRPFWDWNFQGLLQWVRISPVKIRPFWDWNILLNALVSVTSVLLKSDHFGIEIFKGCSSE